jgi:hypothetical protein
MKIPDTVTCVLIHGPVANDVLALSVSSVNLTFS